MYLKRPSRSHRLFDMAVLPAMMLDTLGFGKADPPTSIHCSGRDIAELLSSRVTKMPINLHHSAAGVVFYVALLSSIGLHNDHASAADKRPNVVVIIADDLNDLPLSPGGKPTIKTPNIDRIANRGVTFTNAHCNDPICAPSRASMLFGLYPQTSGLYWFERIHRSTHPRTTLTAFRLIR